MKRLWKITGTNFKTDTKLKALYIEAESADEALKTAREKDRNYCTGQVVDKVGE